VSVSSALSIRNLNIDYVLKGKTLSAVKDLSFEVKEGEIFALLGPNGAGKSSVIHALCGVLTGFKGEIDIFGSPAGSIEAKRSVGIVPQELVNHGFFSVQEVLRFYSGYFGMRNNKKQIQFLMDRLQLTEHQHKKMAQLSGGMKRRVMIAKALLHSPKLLLLDEPSAGVDVELRNSLWEFVRELNKEGTSILLTTHYLEEAERLCERIAIINRGSLIAFDRADTLIRKLAERKFVISLSNQKSISSTDSRVQVSSKDEKEWVVRAPQALSIRELFKSLNLELSEIDDLHIEEGALEDAFLRIVKS